MIECFNYMCIDNEDGTCTDKNNECDNYMEVFDAYTEEDFAILD